MRKLQFFLWLPPFIYAKNIVRLKAADNPVGVLFFDHFSRSELFIPDIPIWLNNRILLPHE